jgi:spermidine/putrescine-binding protein
MVDLVPDPFDEDKPDDHFLTIIPGYYGDTAITVNTEEVPADNQETATS